MELGIRAACLDGARHLCRFTTKTRVKRQGAARAGLIEAGHSVWRRCCDSKSSAGDFGHGSNQRQNGLGGSIAGPGLAQGLEHSIKLHAHVLAAPLVRQ